jgi:Rrf2 family protein
MLVSQKAQYALRAIFELARRHGTGWVKISELAEAQAIPIRFLEVILNQVKQAGFIVSRRGVDGGYMLVPHPKELSVGQVLSFVQGPVGPVDCVVAENAAANKCPMAGNCAFIDLWHNVQRAISNVYDNTSFQDLLDADKKRCEGYVPSYCI